MNNELAKRLLVDTFDAPFDEGRFNHFALNLLNDVDTGKGFSYLSGNYIRHSFKNHITKYRRLGSYTDPQGETIDVLVVKLKNDWALERSRTMLRNFTADYLKNRGEKDAALVAYYTNNPEDWRFSYIRMDYTMEATESGKIKVKEKLTPARRYSFLVGVNEPNHTAQSQLLDILEDDKINPSLSDLESAFSVDAVSKQFYLDYRSLFERIHKELDDIVGLDNKIANEFETKSIDIANFSKKLMGQIVFLYFLQKKGWLGVGKDENGNFKEWGTGSKYFLRDLFDKKFTDYGNFFNDVLEPLFYEALASEHDDDYYSSLDCKIPFLNGGLFEPINDYNWAETDICIDNDLLADVFTTFDQYNFTVREDEPLEKEVAIDPEMLGKVFENLLPENLRKGKGAYYTPRTIVHYMCQESLINYLDTECESIPKEDIETLIREGDTILELETAIHEEGKKYQSVLMNSIKDNAQAIDNALASIKVCDPAIGSGAFPVGMLNEIVKARKVLELYLEKEETTYTLKRHCIQESIYGVDIDPGAIDIAKLRLWLSLVVDENDYTNIQALPNLDYKIMQGNSLIEEFHGISLDIEKKSEQVDVFSGGASLDALIEDLHQKQADFFNAEHPKDKKKKRENVETAIYNIFHHELKKNRNVSPHETQEIEADLKEMTHGHKVRNFFPWKLYFADVFRGKGGFDVVIANPPYGAKLTHKEKKYLRKIFNFVHTRTTDSFNFFLALSQNKLIDDGVCVFIIPSAYIFQFEYSKSRGYFINENSLFLSINLGENVFDAVVPSCIFGFQKGTSLQNNVFMSDLSKSFSNSRGLSFNNNKLLNYTELIKFPDNTIPINFEGQKFVRDLTLKMPKKLGDFCDEVNSGVTTGNLNVFMINDKTIEEYNLEKSFIKPTLQGRDLNKYAITDKYKYVIYSDKYFKKNKAKNIYNYLLRHYDELNKRSEVKQGIKDWFKLGRARSSNLLSPPKIICRETGDKIKCTVDGDGYYVLNTIICIQLNIKDIEFHYFISGILNSKLMDFIFKQISQETGRTFAKVRPINLRKLPVPNYSNVTNTNLSDLVNQILTVKKTNPQVDTSTLEAEIDRLVYELYGLTDEEIAIVEESVN